MRLNTVLFLSLLFTALAMGASLAHLLELPNKMKLSADEYRTVQQIYQGWSLLGIVVFGAIISNVALVVVTRSDLRLFLPALLALLCLAGAQVVFWTYTYPANHVTAN